MLKLVLTVFIFITASLGYNSQKFEVYYTKTLFNVSPFDIGIIALNAL